ncbi:glycosyltransferase family 2 protein [Cytobacillus gottheilii]|uniref:glycosyltransferase family 2 protein n=1 Tax=Cytobacillus gottheilii TaxID=859144 RepID=UPI0009BA8FBC|nr:glycosyltransferase [Cytobacillus gottheilii]
MKKISVIIPVYNMEQSLEYCMQSILNQTYKNFEIILVDDGSKDNSYKVCCQLAKKDSRIKVVHTENRGSGPARNTGIDLASGDYVYFPDADDILASNTLEKLTKIIEKESHDLIVFGYKSVNSDGKLMSEKSYPYKVVDGDKIRSSYFSYITMTSPFGIQGAPWNKLFNLKLIKEHGLYFPALRRHQDDAFIGKYMCFASSVCFIEDVFYTYYTNDLSKEWDKYPVTYLDAVIGLNQIRKETIWLWNKEDMATHNVLKCEFICNAIKALELSFSSKMNLTISTRKKWIVQSIKKAQLDDYTFPDVSGYRYQKWIMRHISHKNYYQLYLVLATKVFLQKNLFSFYMTIKKQLKSSQ